NRVGRRRFRRRGGGVNDGGCPHGRDGRGLPRRRLPRRRLSRCGDGRRLSRRNGGRWLPRRRFPRRRRGWRFPQRRFPPRSGGWSFPQRRFRPGGGGGRLPQRRFPPRFRRVTQLRVPARICTARPSVCVRPVQSIPPPPLLRLCRGAVRRRRWPLWRLVLELAADTVGMAARLGLRRRLRLLLRRRETPGRAKAARGAAVAPPGYGKTDG